MVLVFERRLLMYHMAERGRIKSLACCDAETSYSYANILYGKMDEQMKIHSASIEVFVELSSYFISELRVLAFVRRCVKNLLSSCGLCKVDPSIREFCLYVFCVVKLVGFLLYVCF